MNAVLQHFPISVSFELSRLSDRKQILNFVPMAQGPKFVRCSLSVWVDKYMSE